MFSKNGIYALLFLSITVLLGGCASGTVYQPGKPCWTPDGKIIFHERVVVYKRFIIEYTSDAYEAISIIDSTGNNKQEIRRFNSEGSDIIAAPLSCNGEKIIFRVHSGCDGPGIYEMSMDGSSLTKILDGFDYERPKYSSDGTKIAYLKMDPENSKLVAPWIMEADGSNKEEVYEACDCYSITWSTDNNKVAFSVYVTGIIILDLVTKSTTTIANSWDIWDTGFRGIDWSPDGTKFVFSGEDIGIINTDGTGGELWDYGGGTYHYPQWSPDGTKIVFGRTVVRLANADGSGYVDLADWSGNPIRWP